MLVGFAASAYGPSRDHRRYEDAEGHDQRDFEALSELAHRFGCRTCPSMSGLHRGIPGVGRRLSRIGVHSGRALRGEEEMAEIFRNLVFEDGGDEDGEMFALAAFRVCRLIVDHDNAQAKEQTAERRSGIARLEASARVLASRTGGDAGGRRICHAHVTNVEDIDPAEAMACCRALADIETAFRVRESDMEFANVDSWSFGRTHKSAISRLRSAGRVACG